MYAKPLRHVFAAAALVLGVAALPASAAEIATGESLGNACTSCHGLAGRSPGAIPAIAGIPKDQLISLLTTFRDGKTDATIMNRIARGYTDDEIAALADYFSSVSAK